MIVVFFVECFVQRGINRTFKTIEYNLIKNCNKLFSIKKGEVCDSSAPAYFDMIFVVYKKLIPILTKGTVNHIFILRLMLGT